jgi:hypothetical protein
MSKREDNLRSRRMIQEKDANYGAKKIINEEQEFK